MNNNYNTDINTVTQAEEHEILFHMPFQSFVLEGASQTEAELGTAFILSSN